MSDQFVIVGGDAAGMSAASKAKRENPDLHVVVFERGEWVSYGACGLPYYIKDEIPNLDDLVAVEPKEFVEERNIDLRLNHEVVEVDPDDQTVTAEVGGEQVREDYDQLLISTGAHAVEPPIQGITLDNVYTLHNLEDGKAIKSFVDSGEPTKATLIGGGYIGLEMAEALNGRGLDVEIFEALPHVLGPFGERTAEVVEDHLRDKDIDLNLGISVDQILGSNGRVEAVKTKSGTQETDLVVVGTGIKPNVELAEEAGIRISPTGAIATDQYGRTNYDNVYAAGDCSDATNAVSLQPDYVPLALTANRFGRAIGESVATESDVPVGQIVGTALVKVFDLEVARTGLLDDERIEEAGFEPVRQTIETESRAHYYPGGKTIQITMTADRDSGRLLGASMVGEEGVAQRINTVATALHNKVTLTELEQYDLAYSPPFSPVWDPVLTAAKVLDGKR
jgi:NADPH-dependent 2,4-dienoyl-CoA reductase/sulfur reductase-like enzyme